MVKSIPRPPKIKIASAKIAMYPRRSTFFIILRHPNNGYIQLLRNSSDNDIPTSGLSYRTLDFSLFSYSHSEDYPLAVDNPFYQYRQGSVRKIAVATATMMPKYANPVLYQYHMPMIC